MHGAAVDRQRCWTDGPAKLTQALGIDGRQNGVDLTTPAGGLWIEPGESSAGREGGHRSASGNQQRPRTLALDAVAV